MAGNSAVGIDDDLAAGETGVGHGTTHDEFPGGVDIVFCLFIDHLLGENGKDDLGDDVVPDLVMGDFRGVLGGDDDRVDPRGPSVNVLNAHLRLSVRSEVIENLLFPDLRELTGQLVGVHDRHRHKLFGLCGRVAEHHALVSGSACIDSLSDVWGLAVNGRDHPAGFAVKTELSSGITDLSDRFPDNLWKLTVPVGRYLSGDHHKAGCG